MIGRSAICATISPRDGAGDGEPDEDVGADERFGERARGRLAHEARLVRIHVAVAALVDDAVAVAHEDVLALHAEPHVVLGGARSPPRRRRRRRP